MLQKLAELREICSKVNQREKVDKHRLEVTYNDLKTEAFDLQNSLRALSNQKVKYK
jgi:hypothetical protein